MNNLSIWWEWSSLTVTQVYPIGKLWKRLYTDNITISQTATIQRVIIVDHFHVCTCVLLNLKCKKNTIKILLYIIIIILKSLLGNPGNIRVMFH